MKKTIFIAILGILFSHTVWAQFCVYPMTKIYVVNQLNDTTEYQHKVGIKWLHNDRSNIDYLEYLYSSENTFRIDTEFMPTEEESLYKCRGTINKYDCDVYCKLIKPNRIILKFVIPDNSTYIFDIDVETIIVL
jgi:hypothetical protein